VNFDSEIDAALRAYVGHEPPAGMPERILRRCRRRLVGWPALGLAVAAGILALVWVRPEGKPQGEHIARGERAGVNACCTQGRSLVVRRRRESGIRALWRFSQEHPAAARELTVDHEPEPIVPLQIEPIEIEQLGDSGQ
jgi:hypothetical protein